MGTETTERDSLEEQQRDLKIQGDEDITDILEEYG